MATRAATITAKMPVLVIGIAAAFCAPLFAGSLTVTVRDPRGTSVGEAAVEVGSQDEGGLRKSTGGNGRAVFDQLSPGSYAVSVIKEGFDAWRGRVTINDRTIELPVSLKLSVLSTSVQVAAKRSPLANSDPNYQALRTDKLKHVYRVSNLVVNRDAGTFTFRSGSFSFLPPVLGHVTTGVFVGDGNFRMKPAAGPAAVRLKRMMGADSVSEDFTALVLFFSDSTFDEIKQHSELVDESPDKHEAALKRVRDVIQVRREPHSGWPLSQLEILLNYQDIPNYEAEILTEIYNGDTGDPGSFRAFMHGTKYGDLRFLLNPHGAMPMLDAPEEVALLYFNPNSNNDGVWYLGHAVSEHRPDSKEEKRLVAPDHYGMEVLIPKLTQEGAFIGFTVTCALSFGAVEDGVRMAKFDLFPDLQISRVSWNGSEIPFVQENRKHDGSFYLQMPEALAKGRVYNVTFEYAGTPGNVWYPTPASPANRATYDLNFRVPQGATAVATGKLLSQARDGSLDVSKWSADVPITRADFRVLPNATLKTEVEGTTKSRMSLYSALKASGFPPPSSDYMLGDVGNAMRLFISWFGKPASDDISVVVQTGGPSSSWPGLVAVAPIVMLGSGAVASRIGMSLPVIPRTNLDEAFPRMMAGQWWGNLVSPASFHDAWLSTGLSGFSASVYDLGVGNNEFKDRWENAREAILSGTRFTTRPNDAGPLWMGTLNNTPVKPNADGLLNNSKGAYVAQMLRSMMWDPQTLDRDFQTTMKDFLARFANQAVSTEDFKAVVEEHMKPPMDLDGNHKMDWFFNEWVYGMEIPAYHLEYSFQPGENGAAVLEGKLSQSGVSPFFSMLVPVYGESAGKTWRIYVAAMRGNSTNTFSVNLSARPKQILLNINHDVLAEKADAILARPAGH